MKRNVTPQSLPLNAWDFVTATQNAVRAPSWCQPEGSCGEKKGLSPPLREELLTDNSWWGRERDFVGDIAIGEECRFLHVPSYSMLPLKNPNQIHWVTKTGWHQNRG